MADLIPKDSLTELLPAEDVKAVADEADKIHEKMSMAHYINTAANSGQHSITWNHDMSDELQDELKDKGYTVRKNKRVASPKYVWIVAGF